jgi:hypothetical protein
MRLDQVLAHARVGGLAESLDVETLGLGDLVDLRLASLPGRKHGVDGAFLHEEIVVVVTNHVVLSHYFKVVHGVVKL